MHQHDALPCKWMSTGQSAFCFSCQQSEARIKAVRQVPPGCIHAMRASKLGYYRHSNHKSTHVASQSNFASETRSGCALGCLSHSYPHLPLDFELNSMMLCLSGNAKKSSYSSQCLACLPEAKVAPPREKRSALIAPL